MTAPPSDAPQKTRTSYVILEQTGDSNWTILHSIPATSAEAAIRKTIQGTSYDYKDSNHTLVAVPARSWNPVKVTVETKTTVKLG